MALILKMSPSCATALISGMWAIFDARQTDVAHGPTDADLGDKCFVGSLGGDGGIETVASQTHVPGVGRIAGVGVVVERYIADRDAAVIVPDRSVRIVATEVGVVTPVVYWSPKLVQPMFWCGDVRYSSPSG